MPFSKRKQNKGNDNKQDIEQVLNFSFDDLFYWECTKENIYYLKTIKPLPTKVFLLMNTNPISYYAIQNDKNKLIKYSSSAYGVDMMFKFSQGEPNIYHPNLHQDIPYPKENGFIIIKPGIILDAIIKDRVSFYPSCVDINGDETIIEFNCTSEIYKTYYAIQQQKEKEQKAIIEKEKREREEREEQEIRRRILERERKKRKEKEVYNNLLDEGLIYPDETNKRPPIPKDIVDAVWRRDKGQCVYCGSKENLQLDHIIPFSKGGATTFENLQLLCQKCNLKKSNHIG